MDCAAIWAYFGLKPELIEQLKILVGQGVSTDNNPGVADDGKFMPLSKMRL